MAMGRWPLCRTWDNSAALCCAVRSDGISDNRQRRNTRDRWVRFLDCNFPELHRYVADWITRQLSAAKSLISLERVSSPARTKLT